MNARVDITVLGDKNFTDTLPSIIRVLSRGTSNKVTDIANIEADLQRNDPTSLTIVWQWLGRNIYTKIQVQDLINLILKEHAGDIEQESIREMAILYELLLYRLYKAPKTVVPSI